MSVPRRRYLLLLAGIAAGLLVIAAALLVSLPFLVDLPRVQALLRSEASRLLDRPVEFERVSLSYWPLPAVRIRRLTVANAPGFGPDPLLGVEEARVRVRLLPLVRGRLQFGEVTLARPHVVVEQRRDGAWNLPAPGPARPAPAAPFVLVSRVRLRQGLVEIRLPDEPGRSVTAHLVDRIDVTLDDLGWSHPMRFVVSARMPGGGIGLALDGQVGPLAAAGNDLAAVPARLTARFTAEEPRGSATAPFALTGKGEGELRAEGRLGSLAGGGRLRFGRLTLTHRPAACPTAGPRSLLLEAVELPVEINGPSLTVRPFAFRVGAGTVQGDAALGFRAGTPTVRLAGLRVQSVAAEPVLVEFLCQPYAVTGRVEGSGDIAFTGLGDDLRRSAQGAWELRVGPGRLVGPAMLTLLSGVVRVGSVVYSAVTLDAPRSLFGSPADFQSLMARGTLGGGQLRVRDLALASPELRVTGGGTYGLVDTRLDFTLHVRTGRSGFAVKVGGTTRAPTYGPATRGALGDLADVLSPLIGGFRRSAPSGAAPPPTGSPGSR
ncbi:MAG TPA: AsmA-like C-terminal region-containing protein [Chloroflexota bacterium]|jgi:AsmA protein|nr:AsmA-like C-terminal region-containing protein [Chloroflexota bacterium]